MKVITNVSVYTGEEIINEASVFFENGKIEKVVNQKLDIDENTIDGKGCLLSPGFCDIHIHGSSGSDIMDCTPEAVKTIAKAIVKRGTTSFLATTLTMDTKTLNDALLAVKKVQGTEKAADILGVHLEGPFISVKRKGAQNEKFIIEPTVENYKQIDKDCEELVKRITIAPELEGAGELIKYLTDRGVCVSCGHTVASFEDTLHAVDCGANLCTHLYNGMNPLHHRDPGVVGAALYDDRMMVEFIADTIHLNVNTLKMTAKIKGYDKCILISDAMSAACSEDGMYKLGGLDVTVKDGSARLSDGTLAGSIIMVADAVKNMTALGLPRDKVLQMATVNPAKMIGADSYKGKIQKGYDADMVLLDDEMNVVKVFAKGIEIE